MPSYFRDSLDQIISSKMGESEDFWNQGNPYVIEIAWIPKFLPDSPILKKIIPSKRSQTLLVK